MSIKKEPFRKYSLDENKSDVVSVKFNTEERKEFEEWKYLLQQERDSSALKELARIGSEVLLERKFKVANQIILNNYRKNKKLGIVTFD